MIENKLQFSELSRLLHPFLCLLPFKEGICELEDILGISIRKENDIVCQTKVLLTYKGYRLEIKYLRWVADFGFAVIVQFNAKQKWAHGLFYDQNKQIVSDIQQICTSEIQGLTFSRFQTPFPEPSFDESDSQSLVFYHDSRAFNPNWRTGAGIDIAPLLLAPDAHHGNCFVEFSFNPGGYMHQSGTTILRPDWLKYAFTISVLIEREARQRLGME